MQAGFWSQHSSWTWLPLAYLCRNFQLAHVLATASNSLREEANVLDFVHGPFARLPPPKALHQSSIFNVALNSIEFSKSENISLLECLLYTTVGLVQFSLIIGVWQFANDLSFANVNLSPSWIEIFITHVLAALLALACTMELNVKYEVAFYQWFLVVVQQTGWY